MAAEKNFEEKLKRYIRRNGGWVVKIHADAMQGRDTLDLVGGFRGKPFLVDVKAPDGVVERIQKFAARRARMTGYVTGFVSSIEEFDALFDAPKEKVPGRGRGRPRKVPLKPLNKEMFE